jgi:hypothetical protein
VRWTTGRRGGLKRAGGRLRAPGCPPLFCRRSRGRQQRRPGATPQTTWGPSDSLLEAVGCSACWPSSGPGAPPEQLVDRFRLRGVAGRAAGREPATPSSPPGADPVRRLSRVRTNTPGTAVEASGPWGPTARLGFDGQGGARNGCCLGPDGGQGRRALQPPSTLDVAASSLSSRRPQPLIDRPQSWLMRSRPKRIFDEGSYSCRYSRAVRPVARQRGGHVASLPRVPPLLSPSTHGVESTLGWQPNKAKPIPARPFAFSQPPASSSDLSFDVLTPFSSSGPLLIHCRLQSRLGLAAKGSGRWAPRGAHTISDFELLLQ